MVDVKEAVPGSFCWFELGTTDQEAAKAFYGALFGWVAEDFPMGPGMGSYTIFRLGGRDAAAAYTLGPLQAGVPPHWMTYVAVADADASTAKAKDLGGTVLAGPFDVFDKGRMAILKDPTGAAFSIWQSKASHGVGVCAEVGSIGWAELATRDTAAARAFYTGLFGWGTKESEIPGVEYTEWMNGSQPIGGMMPMSAEMAGVPPHWLIYAQVADCDATVARATEMGGGVTVPPMDIPKVGRFAVLADPQGAHIALVRLDGV